MQPYKETLIGAEQPFPVDVFIQDNLKRSVIVQPHWHDCVEILYMLCGTADQQINDRQFQMVENDIIIINHGDVHATFCHPGEDVRIMVVKFLPELLNSMGSMVFESKYITAFLNNRNRSLVHISAESEEDKNLREIVLGIYKEFTGKSSGYEIYIKGYIYQLIACLIRKDILSVYHADMKEKQIEQLDTLLKYIEENYTQPINLKDAAAMLNFSYHYLSRFFKKVTGKNFKEYVDFVRVCEAEKLLLSKDMSISRVAYEVGFSDVTSFNRVFRRVRDYAPNVIKKTKTVKD